MPSISFELPHWLYWATLVGFPLLAMVMARRGRATGYSLTLGYMILLTGGLLGLHRFYLRNLWGLAYLPLFLGVLFANAEGREAREVQSDAANAVRIAERMIEREGPRVEGAAERLAQLEADLAVAEPGSFAERRAERSLTRERARIESARTRVAGAEADLTEATPRLEEATATRAFWSNAGLGFLMAIGAFAAVDALLLPWLKRTAERRAAEDISSEQAAAEARLERVEEAEKKADTDHIGQGWPGAIDRLSYFAGEFVSYWAVIAVLVYYYEVLARYVFNSPTNWAHEGMFLMFGMQYLIAGAYAMMTEAHVRVDIFYAQWSALRKAYVDLFTSIFFFIFAGTLLVTGWIFAMDSTRVGEISFSEWAIAYWPFKWAMVAGGLLLVLQGVAKFSRDIDAIRSAHANLGQGA
ncbi:MAG: TRAP transporter small permease subunit [Pseudomonadota bacterium]